MLRTYSVLGKHAPVLATCAVSRTMRSPIQSARTRGTF